MTSTRLETAFADGGKHPYRVLLGILRPHRRQLSVAIFFFVLKDSPLWILPILTGNIIDIVVSGAGIEGLWINFAVAAAILAQNYPMSLAFVHRFSTIVRSAAAELRNMLTQRLQELSIGFHHRSSSSVIQTKVVRDVENVELMLQQCVGPGMSAITVLIGALATTAVRVPSFVLVFAVTVPIGVVLVRMLQRSSADRNEQFRKQVENLSAKVGEMASLMPITRAHGLEQVAALRVAGSAEDVRHAGLELDRLNGRFNAAAWIAYQVLGLCCLVLAATVSMTGFIPVTAGEVVLLSSYFAILTGGIISLLGLAPILARGGESIRSMAEVMQDPDIERNHGKAPVQDVLGDLRLENVRLSFPASQSPALDGISVHIRPGETVAFVGPTGSGKSTLLNVALGFLRPGAGRVLLDGADMASLDLRTYRNRVSIVPQEPVLFEGSIRDNVTYGREGVPDDQVRAALVGANAAGFVDELPRGWHTPVGERGTGLSGGQRQRIAIARALVRDPRVLFLDEATSALDVEAEAQVRDALARLMQGRTTLVVAHRLSTIRSATRIVVLERGRIVEIGSHHELLELHGAYARMHRLQDA
ncbi:ABC transporter ATP-binding protein [Arthrobacter sp. 35W]|uniref:ABC transporter ATP-binding protein n=1 Tax=Arthrobacter sp. 35W TaxID=1132441 RepID=UPI00041CEEF0|nr:ABC transporter ATP-binding protein [Arthrobacter sp. 35W]